MEIMDFCCVTDESIICHCQLARENFPTLEKGYE